MYDLVAGPLERSWRRAIFGAVQHFATLRAFGTCRCRDKAGQWEIKTVGW